MEESSMRVSELQESGVFQDPILCEAIVRNLLGKNESLRSCNKKLERELQEERREKANWHVQAIAKQALRETFNIDVKDQVESLKNDLQVAKSKIVDLEQNVQGLRKAQQKNLPMGKELIYNGDKDKLLCDTYIRFVEVMKSNENDPLYQEVNAVSEHSEESSTSTMSDASAPPRSQKLAVRRRSLSLPLPPLPLVEREMQPIGDLTNSTSSGYDFYSSAKRLTQPAADGHPGIHANLAAEERCSSFESDVSHGNFSFSSEASNQKNERSAPPVDESGSQDDLPMTHYKVDNGAKRGKKKSSGLKGKLGKHF